MLEIGVYKIHNNLNKKFYVGASQDIKNRFYSHKNALENNSHSCQEMQGDYNVSPNNFCFEILEGCNIEKLAEKEYFWIKKLNAIEGGYNSNLPSLKKEKNTIKRDLECIGIMQKIYAEYLGISKQCLSYRLKRKATIEERNKFKEFLKFKGVVPS